MSKFNANKESEKGVLYCTVRWSNHNNNVNQFLSMHYAEEKYTDVVIACEGHLIKAHRMILAGCSPYFEVLFNSYEAKLKQFGQPMCVVLDGMGIAYPTLQLILEFMYSGEIRVKKSELESLVRGGVKLKVKGLDAVKLGDKQPDKPNEARTIIGRSELKSPQVLKLAVPPIQRSPATASAIATAAAPEPSPRKRVIEIVQPPPAASRAKSVALKSKSPGIVPKMLRPVPPPMINPKKEPTDPEITASQGSSKVTSDSPEKIAHEAKETVVAQRSASPSGSPAKKPAAHDGDSEGSRSSPVKSFTPPLRDQDVTQADPGSRQTRRSRNGTQKHVSAEPATAATPTSDSPATGEPEEVSKLPEESPSNQDAQDPNDAENTVPKIDEVEENGEAEPVSKRRVIKKPARLADVDFVQEIKFPPMKKRKVRESPSRKQLAEENSESTPGEEASSAEAPKKRKGVFTVFCQEFREKVLAENPGESNSEITKRLSTMWKNLDPSEKEKYCHPPKASRK